MDRSGWEDVYKILNKDRYTVSIIQNPTSSLADDVAATKRALAGQKALVILVGHSYRRVVVTEGGNDPRVAGLVLYRGLCSGQRGVCGRAHQRFAARRTRAADTSPAGRLSLSVSIGQSSAASFTGDVFTPCFAEPTILATVYFDESLSRQNRSRHYRE